jgi:hypothetical protein
VVKIWSVAAAPATRSRRRRESGALAPPANPIGDGSRCSRRVSWRGRRRSEWRKTTTRREESLPPSKPSFRFPESFAYSEVTIFPSHVT